MTSSEARERLPRASLPNRAMQRPRATGSVCVIDAVYARAADSRLLGSRRSFSALDLLAQEPHAHQPGKRDDESQEKKRRPRERQVLGVGRVAGDRTNVYAPEGGERGEQRVLRGGEAMVAQRHQKRDESRRPHAPGDVLE